MMESYLYGMAPITLKKICHPLFGVALFFAYSFLCELKKNTEVLMMFFCLPVMET